MIEICISPENAWEYMTTKQCGDDEAIEELLASNDDYEIVCYEGVRIGTFVVLVVDETGDESVRYVVQNREEFEQAYEECLDMLAIPFDDDCGVSSPTVNVDYSDWVIEREDEIREAVDDFLFVVTDGEINNVSDEDYTRVINDCKEHFLMYLYKKHGLPIFRPMVLVDDKGAEFIEEYPYLRMTDVPNDN